MRWPSDAELEAMVAAGRAAWPAVDVSPVEFICHLADRVAPGEDARAAAASLQIADLYLACGCAQGLSRAIHAFETHLLGSVPRYVANIDSSPSFADDVAQSLREKLFVRPADGAAPKIAGYSGRGQLPGWLRVAAVNTALALRKPSAPAGPSADEICRNLPAQGASPELDYLRAHYKAEVEAAFREAFAELPDKDRSLFRLHYGEGVQQQILARTYGVSAPTMTRWLARAQRTLIERTNALLLQRLSLTESELSSLMDDVKSQLHLSLQGVLRR